MSGWIIAVLPEEIVGGIPDRSSDDLLEPFEDDLRELLHGALLAGSDIDLSKCFGRENWMAALSIAQELGLEPERRVQTREGSDVCLAWASAASSAGSGCSSAQPSRRS